MNITLSNQNFIILVYILVRNCTIGGWGKKVDVSFHENMFQGMGKSSNLVFAFEKPVITVIL